MYNTIDENPEQNISEQTANKGMIEFERSAKKEVVPFQAWSDFPKTQEFVSINKLKLHNHITKNLKQALIWVLALNNYWSEIET